MKFEIRMGIPEMKKYWDDLCKRAETNKLGNDKKLVTTQVMFVRLNKGIPRNTLFSESMTFKFCFFADEI